MILFPNAKINLGLDILSRRPDGYHDIATVMVPTRWRDILEIVPARGSETNLTVTGRDLGDCPPERNLVMRAYRALAEKTDGLPPVDIYLRKVIPDGAGLGGGSADAAFTLKGLNSLFNLGFSDADLADVAATLGADCPFFVYNRPMLCTGTGTELSPIELPALPGHALLIVKPPVSVPTAAAYRGVRPALPAEPIPSILASGDIASWQGRLKNDFEPSVFAAFPEVERVYRAMLSLAPLYASMSGSGSAVYGIFEGDILSRLSPAETFAGCAVNASRL